MNSIWNTAEEIEIDQGADEDQEVKVVDLDLAEEVVVQEEIDLVATVEVLVEEDLDKVVLEVDLAIIVQAEAQEDQDSVEIVAAEADLEEIDLVVIVEAKEAVVAETSEETILIAAQDKCTKPHAQNARKNVKSHSNQPKAVDPFTVGIASKSIISIDS